MENLYSIEEISDRLAIYDLYARYVHYADAANFAELDNIFDPDTIMDWSETGYRKMTWQEAKTDDLMGGRIFTHTFHINTNILILFGERRLTAEVVSKTINPSARVSEDTGTAHAFQVHGGYVDQLVRLPDCWKIRHRVWKNAFITSGPRLLFEMAEMLDETP